MRGSKYSTHDKLLWSVHLVLSTAAVPFAARPRFAGPPSLAPERPLCRAPRATGTSGTRKSGSTGATRLYEPEIQYGHNKRCVLTLRSLQEHYNNRERQ